VEKGSGRSARRREASILVVDGVVVMFTMQVYKYVCNFASVHLWIASRLACSGVCRVKEPAGVRKQPSVRVDSDRVRGCDRDRDRGGDSDTDRDRVRDVNRSREIPWPCDRADTVPGSAAVPGTAPMGPPRASALLLFHETVAPPFALRLSPVARCRPPAPRIWARSRSPVPGWTEA
jgi:hypothetical protein